RPAAEIVEAAPVGGLVEVAVGETGGVAVTARGVRALLRGAKPQVPIEGIRNRRGRRNLGQALRPDGTVRPGIYGVHAADFAVPDHLGALARPLVGVALVAHLRS